MGLGSGLMKIFIVVANAIMLLLGLILLGFGFAGIAKAKNVLKVVNAPTSPAVILIIVGFAILAIAVWGCCASKRESHFLLVSYSTLIFVLFVLTLISTLVMLTYQSSLQSSINKRISKSIMKYEAKDKENLHTKGIDLLQYGLECCGANGTSDWKIAHPADFANTLPDSCCYAPGAESGKPKCGTPGTKPFTDACSTAVEKDFGAFLLVLGGLSFAMLVMQFLASSFSCALAHHLPHGTNDNV